VKLLDGQCKSSSDLYRNPTTAVSNHFFGNLMTETVVSIEKGCIVIHMFSVCGTIVAYMHRDIIR